MDVISKLKPKVASLGFGKEELESVATQIQATLQADATDEQIDAAIDAVVPFLKVSQSVANRVINAEKEKMKKSPEATKGSQEPGKGANQEKDDEPAWFKSFREQQEERIVKIEQANVTKSRRTVFEEKIKDFPEKQKAAMLKDFDRITFKDDDDFNSYLQEKETSISEINQELANAGLSKMQRPGSGQQVDETKTVVSQIEEGTKKIIEQQKSN